MTDFLVSLLFGGAILIVFAWDQFKRPSYEPSVELTRLVGVLAPPDLRNGRVYLRAYAAYAGTLLVVYLVVCGFATVPVLKAIGFAEGDGGAGLEARSPTVPLVLSLVMVGLAPGLPPLQRLEAKIRCFAHHLSGIPARLLHGCRLLQQRPLGLPRSGAGLLIPEQDWARLRQYRALAPGMLEDPEDFVEDMSKILAYRAWVMRHRLGSTARPPRQGIAATEAATAQRIQRLVLGLDALIGAPGASVKESWVELAREADHLCADVCALLMLQIEHGLIAVAGAAELPPKADRDQARAAEARLARFLGDIEAAGDESSMVARLWSRATVAALGVAFLWGLLLAHLDSHDPEALALVSAAGYVLTAFLVYGVGLLAALYLHERAVRKGRWVNMLAAHWTVWSGPAGTVAAWAMVASLLALLALSLHWALMEHGLVAVAGAFGPVLEAALLHEGPKVALGAVLALGVIASIDAWRQGAGAAGTRRVILLVTLLAAVLVGASARHLGLEYARAACIGDAATCAAAREFPTLLGVDLRLVSAGLRAGATVALALLVCQLTLVHALRPSGPPGARRRPEPAVPRAPAAPAG